MAFRGWAGRRRDASGQVASPRAARSRDTSAHQRRLLVARCARKIRVARSIGHGGINSTTVIVECQRLIVFEKPECARP